MPHTKRVFDYFESDVIPTLQLMGCKSMLYVGWRRDCKPWWHDYMARQLGGGIGVVDIFPPNIADLEQRMWSGRYDISATYLGDIRKTDHQWPGAPGCWDLIFWDHGPEHVTWEELKETTPLLYDHAGKALLYCCPWGEWPQDAEGGNQNERHVNYVTAEQLSELGMTVKTFGSPGQPGEGELVALRCR